MLIEMVVMVAFSANITVSAREKRENTVIVPGPGSSIYTTDCYRLYTTHTIFCIFMYFVHFF